MLLPVRIYGDPILRKKLAAAGSPEEVLPHLPDMIETMYDDDGIGLSANQVGLNKRFFIIGEAAFENGRPDSVFIDPVILGASDETGDYEEGCLSVPGIREDVERPLTVTVRYTDPQGEKREEILTGLAARVFQHEFDHINGIFFVDRISSLRRTLISGKLKKLINQHS